jgi:hypothetical protein
VREPGAARRRRGADPAAAIKSLAKTIARDSTAPIPDRRLRAEVRTRCYNRMVAVLLEIEDKRSLQRSRYNRSQRIMAAITALMAIVLGSTLLV